MDSYSDMYKTICRLCLSRNNADKMVTLIDDSSDDGLSCFGKAIKTLTKIIIRKDDKLPNVMCQKCICLLKQTIYFKLRCEATEKQLQRLVNEKVNKQSKNLETEQIVCEYVMFNQYFPEKCSLKPSLNLKKQKKGVKKVRFTAKNDNKTLVHKVEPASELTVKIYDFEDFMDSNETTNHKDNQPEEYSHEINNILDTIQEFINMEKSVTNKQSSNRKFKREQRYRSAKERNLVCKICHKILANRITYDHHMQRHNNCRYICDQCGKGFPVLAEMHMHQIARHGVGPYLQCDHCPYKAPRKLNLIEHLRLHTGERPFTCEKCGLTFRRRAIWRNHLVCHMDKQFQCSYCPRKFYRQTSLVAHCNNVHERVYMYMCSICNVTYTKTETVKRHMLVKHGIPREKQGKIMRIRNESSELTSKVG